MSKELGYFLDWVYSSELPKKYESLDFVLLMKDKSGHLSYKLAVLSDYGEGKLGWDIIGKEVRDEIIAYLELPEPDELPFSINNPSCKACDVCRFLTQSFYHGEICDEVEEKEYEKYKVFGGCPKFEQK